MNNLYRLFITLTCAHMAVHAQQQFPRWWKEVDHMHLEQGEDPDNNMLLAKVHGEEDHEQSYTISEYPLPADVSVSDIAENEFKHHFYVAGVDANGNFIRIFRFTPNTGIEPLHVAPEATPPNLPTGLAVSDDNQHLYAATNDSILVYDITPQNTLQLIQTVPAPQRKKSPLENHLLLTTPFANHNFLIDLAYDAPFIPHELQPTVPGTRGDRWRVTGRHQYYSLPGGRQARGITVYQLLPNGQIRNSYVLDYARQRDPYTNRPLMRPFNDGAMYVKESPIMDNDQELYEVILESNGSRYVITDTFHINPVTGVLTLHKSKKKSFHETGSEDNERYQDHKAKYAPFDHNEFTLPDYWRAQIGREIIKTIKEEESSLIKPGQGTLHDVDKIIAEFATGVSPAPVEAPIAEPEE